MVSNSIPILNIEDKINASYLGDNRPAIILEGDTDIFIYEKILTKLQIDWSEVDLIVGGGKPAILKKHFEGLPFKYIAILDSDYDRHNNTIVQDQHLVYTHFYTIENYLTSIEVINKLIDNYGTIRDNSKNAQVILKNIFKTIEPLIMLCHEKMQQGWGVKLEDYALEHWNYHKTMNIDIKKIEEEILLELSKLGLNFHELDWVSLDKNLDEAVQNGLVFEEYMSGKRIFDALYYQFSTQFPAFMSGRKKNIFKRDMVSLIFENQLIFELLDQISLACLECMDDTVLIS